MRHATAGISNLLATSRALWMSSCARFQSLSATATLASTAQRCMARPSVEVQPAVPEHAPDAFLAPAALGRSLREDRTTRRHEATPLDRGIEPISGCAHGNRLRGPSPPGPSLPPGPR